MSGTQILITTTLSCEENTIVIRDAISNNIITSYKTTDRTIVPSKCLALIDDFYLICTYANTAILNVWSLTQKESIHRKIILPKSNPSCLIVSSDSSFIIIGIESKIYIWDLKTGRLLNILENHYGNVTNLALTDDCSRLISAGQDTLVQIWDFAAMIVPAETFSIVNGVSSRYRPMRSISLPYGQINDLYLTPCSKATSGLFGIAFSKGHVALYSLNGQHIASLVFSGDKCTARSLVIDRSQTRLYVGMENGDIVETLLSSWSKNGSPKSAPQLVDLNIESEISEISSSSTLSYQKRSPNSTESTQREQQQETSDNHIIMKNILKGHNGAVTCLVVRWDGLVLISGSLDKKIMFWDVQSRQCTQTLHQQGPISNIILTNSLSGLSVFNSLDSQFNLEIASSNVSNDISFASSSNWKRSKSVRSPFGNSNGQLMKLPIHPPSTIATEFQRTINMNKPYNFEAKNYSTQAYNSKNYLEFGTMIVENSTQDFMISLENNSSILMLEEKPTNNDKLKDDQLKGPKRNKIHAENNDEIVALTVKELIEIDPINDYEYGETIFNNLNF